MPHEQAEDFEVLASFQRELQLVKSTSKTGPNITFDDFALILRFIQIKNGGFPDAEKDNETHLYDHLVIDEAQDFGAIELKVLLSSVRSKTGTTIVGDLNQKIIPQNDFIGWEQLENELGIANAVTSHLTVSHRCTKEIMQIANLVIDDKQAENGGRSGTLPQILIDSNETKRLTKISEYINERLKENPQAHICIVCRSPKDTTPFLENLSNNYKSLSLENQPEIRLGHNNNFLFTPGVTVTNMRQIKGLEFDTVIIIEPTEANYPNNEEGKRLLYTTITRAQEQLLFVSTGEPCHLLRLALEQSLIEKIGEEEIPEVNFDEDDGLEPF
jgi:DNA helicase-2/ATP-dependent DNA helicase PcrA